MAINFPSTPATNSYYAVPEYDTVYFYDGSSWTTTNLRTNHAAWFYDTSPTSTTLLTSVASIPPMPGSFKYRTIYTRGYTAGGYKDGTPWKNVNRTVHSTDITTNLGDLLTYAASYKTGGFSDYNYYTYSLTDTHAGAALYTGSMSMSTETNRSHNTAWNLPQNRTDSEAMMNSNLTIGYIVGGGVGTTDKHNYITEVMLASGSAGNFINSGGNTGGVTVIFGEFRAYAATSSSASAYFQWSNETWTSQTLSWNTDGQPKGLSSKHGHGYGAEGSYGGTNYYKKYSDVHGTLMNASISRPEACGEENCQIGQNWGYTIGSYNSAAQTNNTTKTNYLTDTVTAMGSDTQPKGHDGMSSGSCASASAQIVGGS